MEQMWWAFTRLHELKNVLEERESVESEWERYRRSKNPMECRSTTTAIIAESMETWRR